jgi:hypothetical protein
MRAAGLTRPSSRSRSRQKAEIARKDGIRHVHLSALYPGGVGTIPSVQLFTEYMTRICYCTVRILVLEAEKIDRA